MYEKYNTIQTHNYIPQKAFLYIPIGDSQKKQPDDYKLILENNIIKRLIYQGNVPYTQQQNQIIDQFYQYLQSKQIKIEKNWSRALVYKFLQSTVYDYKKTVNQIKNHTQYQKYIHTINFDDLKTRVQPFLKQGIFYINGRDSKFRPIIITDIGKINSLNMDQKILNQCLIYFFQFLYRNMFINGQVQNVIGIIDVGYVSPFHLIKPMKMTISFLQGNYKYKLHQIYILKTTTMFNFAFGIAKNFMKKDTIRKIVVIEDQNKITPLLQYCNPKQIQSKFGGAHQNLENGEYWPPKQFSNEYLHPNIKVNIITQQQYKQLYKSGKLTNRKIYRPFIQNGNTIKDIPFINQRVSSIKNLQKNSSHQKQKKNPQSFMQRFFKKFKCHTCFGEDIKKNTIK